MAGRGGNFSHGWGHLSVHVGLVTKLILLLALRPLPWEIWRQNIPRTWILCEICFICAGLLPSPSTYFFFQSPLCWDCLCSGWLVTGSCLLFLFSIQLPPTICSWDVIWCIHHRNYDPWRTDQVLVTGEGVIWGGGIWFGGRWLAFSIGYTILCGYLCPFTLYKDFRSGVQNSFKVFRNMEAIVVESRTRTV